MSAVKQQFWVTEPNAYLEPRGEGVPGGTKDRAKTILEVLANTVQRHGDKPALALKRKVMDPKKGKLVVPPEWRIWTWNDYHRDIKKFAKSLAHLKVDVFRIINIIGFNSPEWFIANNGAIYAGCIAAGVYSTNLPEACHYITSHSKAQVICVDSNKQLDKYARDKMTDPHCQCADLKAIVMWDEIPDPNIVAKFDATKIAVYTWDQFLDLGAAVDDGEIDRRHGVIKPGNCSTLIYTSGTTGPPKAVMISHDNLTWTVQKVVDQLGNLGHTDRFISYLPLSHIAAQMIDIHAPMNIGCCTYFAQLDALKGSLKFTLTDVRPTIFFGVPRVWEKFQEAMVELGRNNPAVLQWLSTWAKGVGRNRSELAQYGAGGGAPCMYSCANAIILSKVKAALGLDQCKGCFTAAAPIATEVLWYFASLDIPVYEVFGQSECTGPHTISREGQWKIGYCGRPIPGSVSREDPKTFELQYAGRHIFMGYMYDPVKTAETIDADGFLKSGDIGEFDENVQEGFKGPSGFLKITGRIKELIITAGGENIPPILIENQVKAACSAISNCMLIGDKRKFLSMVLSLKVVASKDTPPGVTDDLAPESLHIAKSIGSDAKTYSAAKACPIWKNEIDRAIKTANAKTTSSAQIVNKWAWLPEDFSQHGGTITETQKLKRNVAHAKYLDLIESLYAGGSD